jgi:cytochrome c oxidase subunit II
MRDWLGLPEVASAHGADIDHIIVLIHILMGVMFVGWLALFLYMLVRFRRKRHPVADYTGLQSHGTKWAEWAVVLAEVILLVGFSIPLWSQRVDAFPPEDEAVEVRVIGEQFAWNAHYAGNDGIFGRTDPKLVNVQSNPVGLDRNDPNGKDDVVTVNQLHLPVDQPAIVHLTSKDVIHSFMLNEFRTKQDAMPGLSIPVWFEPTVTTAEMQARLGNPEFQYEIACAQLCGIGHSKMRGFLTVHGAGEFERWLAAESTAAGTSESDDFWE